MRLLLLLLFCFFTVLSQAGGPWAEGKGKGYVETSALFAIATTTKDHTYQVYGELGLLDKLTLKLIIPVKYVSTPNDLDPNQFQQGDLWGMSNVVLGLKYQVLKKKVVMSVGFDAQLRTFNKNEDLGLRTGFEKYVFRPLLSVGFGIEKLYTYGEIRPGFSTNNHGHDMNIIYEIGGKVDDNVWLAGYFEFIGVFKNGGFNNFDDIAFASTGFFRDRQNFFTAGVKLSADLFEGFGVNGAVFYGSSVSQAQGGSAIAVKAGLYYNW